MGHFTQRALLQVGQLVSETPDQAISVGVLARQLGVTYGTARRRLLAWAEAKGLALEATRVRVGERGPESAAYYLRPALEARVREAVLAALPRAPEAALSQTELEAQLARSVPKTLEPALLTRWVHGVLTDPHAGVVLTPERRLYLDPSTAKTGRMPAVKRAKPPLPGRRGPQADPSPQQRAPRAEPALPADLPAATLAALTPTERRALAHLLHRGLARTSELSSALALGASRLDGMLRAIRAKLRAHGGPTFTDEPLPSGETLYRVTRGAR